MTLCAQQFSGVITTAAAACLYNEYGHPKYQWNSQGRMSCRDWIAFYNGPAIECSGAKCMFKLFKRDELVSVCSTFSSAQVMAKRHANPSYRSTFTIEAPRGACYIARLVQGERAKWQRIR